jgi:hypothetical protein
MSSTRAQQGALITSAATNGFLAQAIGSSLALSIAVLTEGAGVGNHVNRLALARAVISAPITTTTWMLPGYLQSSNIVAAAGTVSSLADSDVDAQTTAIWNFYANANGAVPQFGS